MEEANGAIWRESLVPRIGKDGVSPFVSRISQEAFVGHHGRTGAVLCIATNGFVRGNNWTRKTLSDAWESTNWEGLCGTPWPGSRIEEVTAHKRDPHCQGLWLKEHQKLNPEDSASCLRTLGLLVTMNVLRLLHRMEQRLNLMMMNPRMKQNHHWEKFDGNSKDEYIQRQNSRKQSDCKKGKELVLSEVQRSELKNCSEHDDGSVQISNWRMEQFAATKNYWDNLLMKTIFGYTVLGMALCEFIWIHKEIHVFSWRSSCDDDNFTCDSTLLIVNGCMNIKKDIVEKAYDVEFRKKNQRLTSLKDLCVWKEYSEDAVKIEWIHESNGFFEITGKSKLFWRITKLDDSSNTDLVVQHVPSKIDSEGTSWATQGKWSMRSDEKKNTRYFLSVWSDLE